MSASTATPSSATARPRSTGGVRPAREGAIRACLLLAGLARVRRGREGGCLLLMRALPGGLLRRHPRLRPGAGKSLAPAPHLPALYCLLAESPPSSRSPTPHPPSALHTHPHRALALLRPVPPPSPPRFMNASSSNLAGSAANSRGVTHSRTPTPAPGGSGGGTEGGGADGEQVCGCVGGGFARPLALWPATHSCAQPAPGPGHAASHTHPSPTTLPRVPQISPPAAARRLLCSSCQRARAGRASP